MARSSRRAERDPLGPADRCSVGRLAGPIPIEVDLPPAVPELAQERDDDEAPSRAAQRPRQARENRLASSGTSDRPPDRIPTAHLRFGRLRGSPRRLKLSRFCYADAPAAAVRAAFHAAGSSAGRSTTRIFRPSRGITSARYSTGPRPRAHSSRAACTRSRPARRRCHSRQTKSSFDYAEHSIIEIMPSTGLCGVVVPPQSLLASWDPA